MERGSAEIEDAKVCLQNKRAMAEEPPDVAFADTEAVIVTAKTDDGRIIRETFYLRLNADGSLSTAAIDKRNRRRQLRFARFLDRYIIKEVKGYNVRERVGEWMGKSVEAVFCKQTVSICM